MKKNLNAIETFHYVYGAMTCLCGFLFLVLIALGTFFSSGWMAEHSSDPPPAWLGGFLTVLGLGLFLLVETIGILNIYSGRCLARRKNRTLSMVVAAINCLSIPLGLVLGIFTLIALSDEEVKNEYMAIGAAVAH